ncbi:MAG: outer membrane beta-barrel protein, partial [Rhizobacter sp.]|nr:outer membrane beta-barrel protein [Chlorobiales bacterium]
MKAIHKAILALLAVILFASPVSAQLQYVNFGIGVGGGIANGLTDLKIDGGTGSVIKSQQSKLYLTGNVKVFLGPSYVLRLTGGYSQLMLKGTKNLLGYSGQTGEKEYQFEADAIPISLALQLNLLPESVFNAYLYGGGGVTLFKVKTNQGIFPYDVATGIDLSTTPPGNVALSSGYNTSLSLVGGAGLEIFLAENFSFDVNASLTFLLDDKGDLLEGIKSGSAKDVIFASAAGLNLYFGSAPPPPPPPPPPDYFHQININFDFFWCFSAGHC